VTTRAEKWCGINVKNNVGKKNPVLNLARTVHVGKNSSVEGLILKPRTQLN
jgi:hypothetical protein